MTRKTFFQIRGVASLIIALALIAMIFFLPIFKITVKSEYPFSIAQQVLQSSETEERNAIPDGLSDAEKEKREAEISRKYFILQTKLDLADEPEYFSPLYDVLAKLPTEGYEEAYNNEYAKIAAEHIDDEEQKSEIELDEKYLKYVMEGLDGGKAGYALSVSFFDVIKGVPNLFGLFLYKLAMQIEGFGENVKMDDIKVGVLTESEFDLFYLMDVHNRIIIGSHASSDSLGMDVLLMLMFLMFFVMSVVMVIVLTVLLIKTIISALVGLGGKKGAFFNHGILAFSDVLNAFAFLLVIALFLALDGNYIAITTSGAIIFAVLGIGVLLNFIGGRTRDNGNLNGTLNAMQIGSLIEIAIEAAIITIFLGAGGLVSTSFTKESFAALYKLIPMDNEYLIMIPLIPALVGGLGGVIGIGQKVLNICTINPKYGKRLAAIYNRETVHPVAPAGFAMAESILVIIGAVWYVVVAPDASARIAPIAVIVLAALLIVVNIVTRKMADKYDQNFTLEKAAVILNSALYDEGSEQDGIFKLYFKAGSSATATNVANVTNTATAANNVQKTEPQQAEMSGELAATEEQKEE